MPYISLARRADLVRKLRPIASDAGELNYLLAQVITDFFYNKPLNYQRINDVIGALEGAKAEFPRRVLGPYEDKKIAQNGDVYPPSLL